MTLAPKTDMVRIRKTASCFAIALLIATILWALPRGETGAATDVGLEETVGLEHDKPVDRTQDLASGLEPLDEPARVRLVEEHEVTQEGRALEQAGLTVDHLGHLAPEDLADLVADVRDYARTKRDALESFAATVDTADSQQLSEEANLLAICEIADAACKALELGSYLTMAPPQSILDIPDCEVLQTRATMNGRAVNVVVVMPLANFPSIEAAREYQHAASESAAAGFAHEFNSKGDKVREELMQRYVLLLGKRHRGEQLSADEIRFLHLEMRIDLPLERDTQRWLLHVSPRDPRDR